jgi:hypothetical protein
MYFVTLVKFRKKPSKEDFEEFDKLEKEFSKKGLKILQDLYKNWGLRGRKASPAGMDSPLIFKYFFFLNLFYG